MWALRRASVPFRNREYVTVTNGARFAELDKQIKSTLDDARVFQFSGTSCERILPLEKFDHTNYSSFRFSVIRREFSSQANAEKKGEEDESEDGFAELDTPSNSGGLRITKTNDDDEFDFVPEGEISDNNLDAKETSENELELPETEMETAVKKKTAKLSLSPLFKAIMEAPGWSIHTALDKWVEEGNDLSRSEIQPVMLLLRRRRMYGRALQLSEWLEAKTQIEFGERDYASRVDLIAKFRGLQNAENYIEKVPKFFRGERIYRTLLANCVVHDNVKKAEEIFNKMKELEFPITPFACNQLLLLYKWLDKKKIPGVLSLMEKENVKPTSFTYRVLIDTMGISNDISGMESVVESMKQEGVEMDIEIQLVLAKHYAASGLKDKVEALLKEIEGQKVKQNCRARRLLLTLYAELGNADEVKRIWNEIESYPQPEECVAAIKAWGKLKNIEEAEVIFDQMVKKWKKLPSRQYAVLLKICAENKMLAKGKELLKRMAESECQFGPLTWHALVKLYVEAGEIENADSILQKAATQKNLVKPMFRSYMVILEQYAKRGDVHNSEKMFFRMRQAGYTARFWQFETLIKAYINAKVPAYGMRERMKADNISCNKYLTGLVVQVDAFRKTAFSELLD